jgi:AcrR family transcriptional regulator
MVTVPGMTPPPPAPGLSLRERKKQQTRWTIQAHALRLFVEQGYEATTIDRVCQEAEVSPSTFFRYFPTKEDVVVLDQYDPLLIEIFHEASLSDDPVRTLRSRLSDAIGQADLAERHVMLVRTRLALSEPAIRNRIMDHLLSTVQMLTEAATTEQSPPRPDRPGLSPARLFVGACLGAWIAAWDVLKDDSASGENLVDFLIEPLAAVRFPGKDPHPPCDRSQPEDSPDAP